MCKGKYPYLLSIKQIQVGRVILKSNCESITKQ